jgi:hypothetical protein
MNTKSPHSPRREGDRLNHHLEEHVIETYVARPQSLGVNARQDVAAHLEQCKACRKIADFLREFYEERESTKEKHPAGIDNFVAKIFPSAHIVALYPYRPEPASVSASDAYTIVLAAKSPKPAPPRFETVATLASEQKDTLLRILRDRESSALRLYILSEDRRKYAHAIISLPDLAVDAVVDEKGQAIISLAGRLIPRNWEGVKCVLRLPLGEVRINAGQLREASQENPFKGKIEDHEIKIVYSQDTLAIEADPFRSGARTSTLAVIGGPASGLIFVALQNGKGTCALPSLPIELTIRLYC